MTAPDDPDGGSADGSADGTDGPGSGADPEGEPETPGEPDTDLAHDLLSRTRGEHLPAGARRRRAVGRSKFRPGDQRERRREGWSGAGPDALDPVKVGAVLDGLISARGWDETMAQARVLSDWSTIVGPDVAAHCSPTSLTGGDLKLAAETTAWATQLRMLETTMLARIAESVGRGVVQRISVTGPVAPSWRHGPRSVQGHRGPRDTYG